MATSIQRWQSIGDALLNKTATQSQLLRAGQAFAYAAQELDAFNAMTNTQKADYALGRLYGYMILNIRQMDAELAEATAKANAIAAVDTEFAPAP